MNYTQLEIDNFNQKDKRISFQSIFSSLCGMFEGKNITKENLNELVNILTEKAFEVNTKLHEEYPIIEEAKPNNEVPM